MLNREEKGARKQKQEFGHNKILPANKHRTIEVDRRSLQPQSHSAQKDPSRNIARDSQQYQHQDIAQRPSHKGQGPRRDQHQQNREQHQQNREQQNREQHYREKKIVQQSATPSAPSPSIPIPMEASSTRTQSGNFLSLKDFNSSPKFIIFPLHTDLSRWQLGLVSAINDDRSVTHLLRVPVVFRHWFRAGLLYRDWSNGGDVATEINTEVIDDEIS